MPTAQTPSAAAGSHVIYAGRPRTANPWFEGLETQKNDTVFQTPRPEAKKACEDIRTAYKRVLAEYNLSYDAFFGGSIKNEEAWQLYELVAARRPKTLYQVGTFVGYSAMILAVALKDQGIDGHLTAVDPEIPHRTNGNPVDIARRIAADLGIRDRITFVRGWQSAPIGDSIPPVWRKEIPIAGPATLEGLGTEVDFAFIDGDHSTSMTIMDFFSISPHLAKDGVMVFHDVFNWPTVAQALGILTTDIHFYERGFFDYFALDLARGFDGLASIRRIATEDRNVLKLTVVDETGAALVGARVSLPDRDKTAVTDNAGAVYFFQKFKQGVEIIVSEGGREGHFQVEEATAGSMREQRLVLDGPRTASTPRDGGLLGKLVGTARARR